MHPRQPIPPEVLRLAGAQENVVSREQCLGLGLTRSVINRLLGQNTWSALEPGLYYTLGGEAPWISWAWAAVLAGGDQGLLCRRSAAHLWGIHPEACEPIQVLIPEETRITDRSRLEFIRSRHPPKAHGSPPRTPLADTVLDLCAIQPDRTATWISQALHTRRTTESGIAKALAQRQRQPHRRLIEAILQQHSEGVHSELERIFRRDVERAHGLPTGRRQIRDEYYCTDVEYLGTLIIELDGRLGHEGLGRFRDMARDNHHLVHGRPTMRYGWPDVTEQPCEVARQIAAVLLRLGWAGPLLSCPRCRRMPDVVNHAA